MKEKIIILWLLLLAFVLLSFRLNKPFVGHHDWNGVFFGNVIRNTQKFGFLKTKFGAVYNLLPQDESEFSFYTHYPLIFRTVLGFSAKIFGIHEWSMRLTAIFFSLLALYLFFNLTEKIFDHKTAFLASLFFVLNPMFLYFGKMPVHEVFGLTLIILSFLTYFNYFQKGHKKNLFFLIFSLFLACQTVWSAYYLIPLFMVHYWFFKKKKQRQKNLVFLIFIPLFCFLSYLGLTYWQTGSWHNNIFSTMLFRMQIGPRVAQYSFTLWQYVKQEALWLTVYFSKIVCWLALFYAFILSKKIINKKFDFKAGFLVLILIFPFIDLIIFRNLCFIHDYKLYYFLISLPLFSSLSLFYFKDKFKFLTKKFNFALLLFLTFSLIILGRAKYTKALLMSNASQQAYDLGILMQSKARRNDLVLIGSPSLGEHLGPFFVFYGQRKAIYFNPILKEFNKLKDHRAQWLILIKSREVVEEELFHFLMQNYSFFEQGDFYLFDLRPG